MITTNDPRAGRNAFAVACAIMASERSIPQYDLLGMIKQPLDSLQAAIMLV